MHRLAALVLALFGLSALAQNPANATAPVSPAAAEPALPLHVGGNIHPPVIIYQVDPTFTEEARRKKISGKIELYLWVEANGEPSHVRVVRGLGAGLDDKAIEAVRQYRFKPATQNGKPVRVDLYVEVNFQIF